MRSIFTNIPKSNISVGRPSSFPSNRTKFHTPTLINELKRSPFCVKTTSIHRNSTQFFNVMNKHIRPEIYPSIPHFIQNHQALKTALHSVDSYIVGNYLHEHFIYWLSYYAKENPLPLQNFFLDKCNLDSICRDFIKFCFFNGISLDAEKTLQSFSYHNQLSDSAVKSELDRISPKREINLLGFGLDEGHYEKNLSQYLLQQNKAKNVRFFGFDPYAAKSSGIEYLTENELVSNNAPKFDLISVRWVLHHVALKSRWTDLINCINRCNNNAAILIVEHGFLKLEPSLLHKKLSDLLNATFDVVANIGLRPHWFTNTAPDIGANFFIHYLEPKDFEEIKGRTILQTTQNIYDVGPGFPNQTICCMRITS